MKTTNTNTNTRTMTPAEWFVWALNQFNLFDRAPRPECKGDGYDSTNAWVPKFIAWLGTGAANERARTVGQFLLRSWNSDLAVEGASALELVYGGCDDTNRRGVRVVLEHVRYF